MCKLKSKACGREFASYWESSVEEIGQVCACIESQETPGGIYCPELTLTFCVSVQFQYLTALLFFFTYHIKPVWSEIPCGANIITPQCISLAPYPDIYSFSRRPWSCIIQQGLRNKYELISGFWNYQHCYQKIEFTFSARLNFAWLGE